MRFMILATFVVAQLGSPQACKGPTPPSGGGSITDQFTTQDGMTLGVQTLVTNVEVPWSLAIAPDGRLFFTERGGRVRVYENGQLLATPALVLNDVRAVGEGGLMGLALHPDFARNRLIYLVYTATSGGEVINRLVRYRETGNTLVDRAVLLERMTGANIHDGGRLRFGPDGNLYLTMGDAAIPSLAQSQGSLNGKILRLNDDGAPAAGNPFGTEVWSLGHRNPQGLDWNPAGTLWATEHGATGNDEINLIQPGANYGWPVIEGATTNPGMVTPIRFFSPSIAPSGASFYAGTRLAVAHGDLFFATLTGRHIHRVHFDPADRTRIVFTERWLENRYGRIRDVMSGPDGALYFCTNNRDGRGSPTATDDRIARIVPVN